MRKAAFGAKPGLLRDWSKDWGGILTLGLAAYLILYLLWLVFRWGDSQYETLIGDITFFPCTFIAAILAWRVSLHPALGNTRRAWQILMIAYLALLAGDILWFFYEVVLEIEPFPSWADAAYLLFYPLLLWGLLSFPVAPRSRTERLKFWLDTWTVLLGGSMVVWYFVLRPTALAGDTDLLTVLLSVAYPVGDLVILLGVITLLLARPPMGSGTSLGILVGGVALFAVADLGFAHLSLLGTYQTGDWPDPVWMVAHLLFVISSQYQFWAASGGRARTASSVLDRGIFSRLPYVAVGLGYGLLLWIAGPEWRQPLGGLAFGAIALTGVVVARQLLVMRENTGLVAERTALAKDLERHKNEARFRALVQNSSDVITVVGIEGSIIYQSPSIERVFGYPAPRLIGSSLTKLVHPIDEPRLLAALAEAARDAGETTTVQWRLQQANGSWRQVESTSTNLLNDPNVRGIVLNTRDITERKELEDQLVFQAFHDPLTGLANRALFHDRVEHAYTVADRKKNRLAILLLDLDNFKSINDSLGHGAGDQLLKEAAVRLLAAIGPTDTAARLGGDEFAVLMEDVKTKTAVTRLAQKIKGTIEMPFIIEQKEVFITSSMGIAVSSAKTGTDELFRNADVATHIAKGRGRGVYQVFEPRMHKEALKRLELEADLRRAVEREEFLLHYQPLIDLRTGRISGAEALVRWKHPDKGLIPPLSFIPVAEETGLVLPIGRWVLENACRQAFSWQSEFPGRPFHIAVNLSAKQLQEPDLLDEISQILEKTRLEAGSLTLEITESLLVKDTEAVMQRMRDLKGLGVRLAIDDFGTGYSSLSYLSRFPIDTLKIDKTFVDGVAEKPALVQAIVNLANNLRLETVAEGIELSKQLSELRRLGCRYGQGYYFAKPLEASAFQALFRKALEGEDSELRSA